MATDIAHTMGLRVPLLLLLAAFQCAAAGPPTPTQRPATTNPREAVMTRPAPIRVDNLPSSLLDPLNEKKVHVSSTDAKGDCPAGSSKIERCSGVYPNGNSWEIAPCCRTVTD